MQSGQGDSWAILERASSEDRGEFCSKPEGNRVQKRLWREMSDKIESLSPGALTVVN